MRCTRRSQVLRLVIARGTLWPRRTPLLLFYLALVFLVSACSLDGQDLTIKRAAPPPSAEKIKAAESIAALPTAMDTFRALAPPEGLKFVPLFSEPVSDTNARLKRLEDAVQTMRNDFDTVVPTMVRMVAIEKDIKVLVAQLQTLTDQGQVPAEPAPAVESDTLPPEATGGATIPGEDVAKGTEPAKAATAKAGPDAASSLVTPEAASKGELPPEDAASPSSTAPVDLKAPVKPAAAPTPAPVVLAPTVKPAPVKTPPPPAKPEVKADTKTETPATPPLPNPSALGNAMDVRIADHANKTRVVLDITVPMAATAKLENNGKTLVIPLSQLNWLGKKSWDADSAELISGYHIEEGNLYVDLMYASQIKTQSVLTPGGDNKNYRWVIDLFSPEVHK